MIKPDELTGIKIQKTPGFSDEAWVQQEKALQCLIDFWKGINSFKK